MLGMFLAVPVIAILKIVIEDYVDVKLKKKQQLEKATNQNNVEYLDNTINKGD